MKQIIYLTFLALSLICIAGCSQEHKLTTQGYIEGRYTYISSQTTGVLKNLAVTKGDNVDINQALFTLAKNPQYQAYNQAQANLAQAKAKLKDLEKGKRPSEIAAIQAQQKQVFAQINFAAKTVARYRKLVKTKVMQQENLDQAISNYNYLNAQLLEINENLKTAKLGARIDQIQAAKDQVLSANAATKQALWQLQQKNIISPISGSVFDTYYQPGEVVPANHPILSLLAPKDIYVIFYLPEIYLAKLKIGQQIVITCDGCNNNISATIYYVASKAEFTPPVIYSQKTRAKLTYRVEARLKASDAKKLHPGQPVDIDLTGLT
jgi:HlyD family secretion protein